MCESVFFLSSFFWLVIKLQVSRSKRRTNLFVINKCFCGLPAAVTCALLLPFFNVMCCLCVDRTDSGPEDRDSEEGGTAVLYEDVHGLSTLLHLPHEVCFLCDCLCLWNFISF